MFKNSAEVLNYIKKENVALIDVRFIDLPGIQHHFNVPASQFTEDVFTEGLMFDGSSIRGFQSIHESDMKLLPAPETACATSLRPYDVLARYGGDEFVLIVHGLDNIWEVEPVLSRLLHVTTNPILAGGVSAWIGFSIGVTIYPQDASDATTLIQHADVAMYKAKRAGGSGWAMWQVEDGSTVAQD